jgi:glutamine cyclotransferase
MIVAQPKSALAGARTDHGLHHYSHSLRHYSRLNVILRALRVTARYLLLSVSLGNLAAAADRLEIVASHPHDPQIFTQGLAIDGNQLYQSSGLRGRSVVVAGNTGSVAVARQFHLPRRYFGEGLAVVDNEVMVLTWQAGTLLVLDKTTLQLKRKQNYQGEGWGLAWDGSSLLISDGSSRITWRDPLTMAISKQIEVHDEWGAVRRLNELEWAHGVIFANIWKSNRLIAIDPDNGRTLSQWNLEPLLPEKRHFGAESVPNGIAYDPASGHFWLSGKGWPLIYEVKLHADWLAKR